MYEKPLSNVISLSIQSKGLKFYYQGPLTDKEKAEGIIRPEEVTGSYAVYHESKRMENIIPVRHFKFIGRRLLMSMEIGSGES